MSDPSLREDFARDVVLLKYVGLNPIVVHGGGPDITAYMQRLNMPVEFVGGLRVSDPDTVEIAKMVLVGKVNKDIVMRLNRHGQPAVGLSGDDGQLFRVATMEGPGGEDIGLVGRIERVDANVIHHIAEDYIPVIASVGADRAGARTTSTPTRPRARWRAPPAPTRSCSSRTSRAGCAIPPTRRRSSPSAAPTRSRPRCRSPRGGMRPKLQACIDAIHGGVSFAHIIDGRQPHSLLLELFTDAGVGTKVRPAS